MVAIAVAGLKSLGVEIRSGILGHPNFVLFSNAGGFPLCVVLQLVLRTVEHSLVAQLLNGFQKCQSYVRPFLFGQRILTALRVAESLAVIGYRVGNGVSVQQIRCPPGFLNRFLLCDSSGEKIGTQFHPGFVGLLKIISAVPLLVDFSLSHIPISNPDNGKIDSGSGNLLPVNGSLVSGHVHAISGFLCFLAHAFAAAACQIEQQCEHQANTQEFIEKFGIFHGFPPFLSVFNGFS